MTHCNTPMEPVHKGESMNIEMAGMLGIMLRASVAAREPDFVIGGKDDPYIRRWYMCKSHEKPSIYLHQILRDDDDRALHDHRGHSASIILSGTLREVLKDGERLLEPGSITFRLAEVGHRLEIVDGPVWTIFITGPTIREWGFHCPQGWRHWKEFTDPLTNGATVGRGCD